MSNRFIWNFEFDPASPLPQQNDAFAEKEAVRWESRFFWPETSIIRLHGLQQHWLRLSNYKIKQHQDTYLLLSEHHYNIKQRQGKVLYKPLLEQRASIYGFGKKINLDALAMNEEEEKKRKRLVRLLEEKGLKLEVEKEALTCKLLTEPNIKLELSRLYVKQQTYFSLCLSGRSFSLVQSLSNHLLPEGNSCDYVNFLKKMMGL